MDSERAKIPQIFESSDVVKLLGIPPFTLNTYVERRHFGIVPSVRSESGRGGRRIFSKEDVFGIGLVWWLFESGLRSQPIQQALDRTNDRRESTANDAAKILIENKTVVLAISRSPRTDVKKEERQEIRPLCSFRELEFDSKSSKSLLVVPIGNLFARLKKAITDFRS